MTKLGRQVKTGTLGRGELLCIVVRRCLDGHVLGSLSAESADGLSETQLRDVTALVTLFGQECLPVGTARAAFADAELVAKVAPVARPAATPNLNPVSAAAPDPTDGGCRTEEDNDKQHVIDQYAWYS